MTDFLSNAFPALEGRLPKLSLADLPTPADTGTIELDDVRLAISIKRDDRTSSYYGGNKLRKLEYLLCQARDKGAARVATFGSVASNHALATTLYAKREGLECTCLLSHQTKTPATRKVLGLLLDNDAEIVRYGGDYRTRINTLRRNVQGRNCRVFPMGGSSWLGTLGYVNAGLELASQVVAGDVATPDSIYIASGTMGSAGGLALGLALAGLETTVQAVRVSPSTIMNEARLQRLVDKTTMMLRRLDPAIPADLGSRVRLRIRHEFYGAGYAKSNATTDRAIVVANEQLGLHLDTTYTGKAMAALLADSDRAARDGSVMMFWNTFNSNPLPIDAGSTPDLDRLPEEFRYYFD